MEKNRDTMHFLSQALAEDGEMQTQQMDVTMKRVAQMSRSSVYGNDGTTSQELTQATLLVSQMKDIFALRREPARIALEKIQSIRAKMHQNNVIQSDAPLAVVASNNKV